MLFIDIVQRLPDQFAHLRIAGQRFRVGLPPCDVVGMRQWLAVAAFSAKRLRLANLLLPQQIKSLR